MIRESLQNIGPIKALDKSLQNKESFILSGVPFNGLAQICAAVFSNQENLPILVLPTEKEAKDLEAKFRNMNLTCRYLPPRDKVYYDIKVIDNETMHRRLQIIREVMEGKAPLLTMSLYTLLEPVMDWGVYEGQVIALRRGEEYDRDTLLKRLVEAGYDRTGQVESRGEFTIRGGILDIFPVDRDSILRIEFFDEEIDTIREVDPDTRLSFSHLDSCRIFPARELLLTDEIGRDVLQNLEEEWSNKPSPKEDKFLGYLSALKENMFFQEREILYDYFPSHGKSFFFEQAKRPLVFYDPHRSMEELNRTYQFEDMDREDLYLSGEILTSGVERKLIRDPFADQRICKDSIWIQYMDQELFHVDGAKETIRFQSLDNYHRDFGHIADLVKSYLSNGYQVYYGLTKQERIDAATDSLTSHGISYTMGKSDESGIVQICREDLNEGFALPDEKLVFFGAENIFGSQRKRKPTKGKKKSTLRISDLSKGDYVIHEDHGAGVFEGIITLEVKGIKKDYLEIHYKGTDKLYVPVENMNLIDTFMSKDGAKPKIHTLYSPQWQKTKERSKKAIEEMAKDLIELYAGRMQIEGHPFSKDTPWQREFEDGFPFEETDGQILATDEIKTDMESIHPMDRLLLGDVGYGKTEVAFRAAFKAIMDGKQVAFLTPTTLLSDQHTKTAMERFKNFPITIRNVSRFRTKKEIDQTLKEVKAGTVDMIIGTHRLLSKDVKFKDLGLLIVDEEQRFGVRHKERIKQMTKTIDVLTLSATPIPRTLSMSLSGIRSLSVLEEPPQNRYPVQTYVLPYELSVIRSAILKEIHRGGQVYFLYNDVRSMEKMAEDLRRIVPEATFAIAHGQMPERTLETIFHQFIVGEFDCLVSSTIIETGMDVANVNTLIVYGAERLGLSTLYQLRGRVGRSNRLAYAYFTYEGTQPLSEKASKRLMAMKEFTDFGSGYKIAMRDLELRGAGNVLGLRQHGHMEQIGYELYMKYLKMAVKESKGEVVEPTIETRIDLEVESALPQWYLPDETRRMEVYRRISALETLSDKDSFTDELIDRFGDLPREVENLMYIGVLKNMASHLSIESVSQRRNLVKLEFHPEFLDKVNMQTILNEYNNRVVFDGKLPILRFRVEKDPVKELLNFFHDIGLKSDKNCV
ncbi:MAG: transcription-repair coupling factor [Tissierellia bacterium]|nr:transcription-repair coupling factor [Tissierellia bacterium]